MCLDVIEIIAMISQYKTQTKATGHKTLSTHEVMSHRQHMVQNTQFGPMLILWKSIHSQITMAKNLNRRALLRTCKVSFMHNVYIHDVDDKKLSYCWETVRHESMPRIAEMDVEMTT